MDKNDEEVGKEFERLINEMEKYSVKDGRKLNDEYRKNRDERPVEDDGNMPEHERAAMGGDERHAADADLYDLGYEDGYHDGKADMMDELEDFVKKNDIEIGILTIPKAKAIEVANQLVSYGVKAIWNFAHTDLNLPEDVIVENVHLSESLMRLSYNISRYNEEQKKAEK